MPEGLLAAAVAAALPPDPAFRVVASDGPEAPAGGPTAEGAWLPVHAELDRVVIGPLREPGRPGCPRCAATRRRHAATAGGTATPADDPAATGGTGGRARNQAGTAPSNCPPGWLAGPAAGLVADLVADDARRYASDPASARTRGALLLVDLANLAVSRHRVLPDPLCPDCGDLPADSPDLAAVSLLPRPKPTPATYRTRPVLAELDQLLETYVDAETGLVAAVTPSADGGLVVGAATMGLRDGSVEVGWGRTRGYRTSILTALLEALERYGGGQPLGRRPVVHASYAALGDTAVDPRRFGSHPEYHEPFTPFDPEQAYRWVWGWSFARREPVLVPAALAYYRMRNVEPAEPRFAYEISNGCALGSTMEEAVLYGLLEVLERDAFLLTWYQRRPVGRIDLTSGPDRAPATIAAAMSTETGYDISVHDTTLDHGVPCVWALARDPDGDPRRPAAVCAAGAHLDPVRATESALSELGPILADLVRRYPDQAGQAAAMVAEPSLVRTMGDHSLLYGHRDALPRLDFLGRAADRSFAEVGTPIAGTDLTDDLRETVDRVLAGGMDVIVVDQTTPEHRVGGFTCVKVLVPGAVPMTFGHRYRRTVGLPRLGTPLNPAPHPFP